MEKMNLYADIAIAGGGPAGATAAYILSGQGYNVILVDKANFPRPKLCGGCLTLKTIHLLENIFNETEENLTGKNIINFQSRRFGIRYKHESLIDRPTNYTFHFVDRTPYDAFFLEKAKNAGTTVIEGEKITNIDTHPALARENDPSSPQNPYTLTTHTGRIIHAPYIIGADGVNSIVRTTLFRTRQLLSKSWKPNLAASLELYIPKNSDTQKNEFLHSIDYPVLLFGYLNYGYCWIFPNEDRWIVGIGGLTRKNPHPHDIKHAFHTFLEDYHINVPGTSSIPGAPSILGHLIPYGNYIDKPAAGNIILAGDAGGMADPMLGEGIFQAHRSGELAAHAIIHHIQHTGNPHTSPPSLESIYLNSLQKDLYQEFQYAKRFRFFLYNPLMQWMNYKPIKFAHKNFDKLVEVVHGDRTFRWFSYKNKNENRNIIPNGTQKRNPK